MKLRKLQDKDAPLMLEWMHDETVTCDLRTDFAAKTIDDCKNFIVNSVTSSDVNYAITGDSDEYLGTVSLKHICDECAEFAITIRNCAMGKGIAVEAMKEMIRIGLDDLGLKYVFWCVAPENNRAIRFYDKNGFKRTHSFPEWVTEYYTRDEIVHFIWYREKANH